MSIRRWCYDRFVNSLALFTESVVRIGIWTCPRQPVGSFGSRIARYPHRITPIIVSSKVFFEVATTAPTTLIYISWKPFDIIETSKTVGSRIVCTSPWVWVVVLSTGDYRIPHCFSAYRPWTVFILSQARSISKPLVIWDKQIIFVFCFWILRSQYRFLQPFWSQVFSVVCDVYLYLSTQSPKFFCS